MPVVLQERVSEDSLLGEAPPYSALEYTPLSLEDDEIRLIRLDVQNGSHTLTNGLSMRVQRLQYTALSYPWGQDRQPFKRRIRVNDRDVPVSKNLSRAIRDLIAFWRKRYPDGRRELYLWCDQICIDQASFAERAHQVGVMGDIYEKAEQVVVWLPVPRKQGVSATLNYWTAHRKLPDMPATGSAGDSDDQQIESLQRTILALEAWHGLQLVAQSPWWSRVWIYQEFILGTRVMFLVDSTHIKWEELRDCMHHGSLRMKQNRAQYQQVLNWLELIKERQQTNTALTEAYDLQSMEYRQRQEDLQGFNRNAMIASEAEARRTREELTSLPNRVTAACQACFGCIDEEQDEEGSHKDDQCKLWTYKWHSTIVDPGEIRSLGKFAHDFLPWTAFFITSGIGLAVVVAYLFFAIIYNLACILGLIGLLLIQALFELLKCCAYAPLHRSCLACGQKGRLRKRVEDQEAALSEQHAIWTKLSTAANEPAPELPAEPSRLAYRAALMIDAVRNLQSEEVAVDDQAWRLVDFVLEGKAQWSLSQLDNVGKQWRSNNSNVSKTEDLNTYISLSLLLPHARRCSCTEPRDRIYAFLGLLDPSYGINADYSAENTITHTMTAAAKSTITVEENLSILLLATQVRAPSDKENHLPSWVPELEISEDARLLQEEFLAGIRVPAEGCTASRHSKAVTSFWEDLRGNPDRILKARGFRADILHRIESDEFGSSVRIFAAATTPNTHVATRSSAKPGDEVWILLGLEIPLTLAKPSRRDQHYTILGPATFWNAGEISSIMRGSLMDQVEAGDVELEDIYII